MQKRLDKPGWWPRICACYDKDEEYTTRMLGGNAGAVRPSATEHCATTPRAVGISVHMQAYFDKDSYMNDIGSADSGVLHALAATHLMVRRPALLFRGWPDNRRD